MNEFFHKLFNKLPHPADTSKHPAPITAQDHSAHATRSQLVQMVLRTIMRKYGIPAHWLELHELVVPGKKQGLAMHIRLVVKHWDPNLMNHAQALQKQMLSDIRRYEPNWKEWLYGVAWQLDMGTSCPYTTLPDKPFWTAPPEQAGDAAHRTHTAVAPHALRPVPAAPEHAASLATPVLAAGAAAGAAAAVLAAAAEPEAAPETPAPARPRLNSEDHTTLERLFAARDKELSQKTSGRGPQGQPAFEDTQPLDDDEEETVMDQDETPTLMMTRIDLPTGRPNTP